MVPDKVHWGWYAFWLLVFWPALIFVIIVDCGKRDKFIPVTMWVQDKEK